MLTITTAPIEKEDVMNLVQDLSRNAKKVYSLFGTQKFKLPKLDIQITAVCVALASEDLEDGFKPTNRKVQRTPSKQFLKPKMHPQPI